MDYAQRLRIYEQQIRNLQDDGDLDINALLVLTTRDELTKAASGEREAARLAALDDQLIERQPLLAQVLPFPSEHERWRWWWFLHEGAQVRDQALQSA